MGTETLASTLDYEPTSVARRVKTERFGEVTRITVAMRRPYVPMPTWLGTADWQSLIVVPLVWLAIWFARGLRGTPTPARAVFEIDATSLRLTLCNRHTGAVLRFAWLRSSIASILPDSEEDGLRVDVREYEPATYLNDLPRQSILHLATELNAALGRAETTDRHA